jgi:hypothetical protein
MLMIRFLRMPAVVVLALSLCGRAAGQAPVDGRGAEPSSRPLTPQEESGLLDKQRLAAEAADQLQGLREAGNPHIPEGLELSHLEENPRETQVDQEKLREAAIRRIENREGFLRPLPEPDDLGGKSNANLHHGERVVPVKPVAEPAPNPRPIFPWNHLVLMAAGVLSIVSVWIAFRK